MADTIELPTGLGLDLPTKGNVITQDDEAAKLAEQQKAAAEQAAAKLAQEKADKEKAAKLEEEKKKASQKSNKEEDTDDELSDEEIQAKLDELAELGEDKLSDEDKKFIQKYTQEEQEEIDAVKSVIEQTYGVKLENKYDNGIEGLKQLTNDVVPQIAENMFKEAMGNVPYLREFYEHVTSGRSIATFLAKNEQPSFEKVQIKPYTDLEGTEKTQTINQLKELVKMDLTAKGNAEEDIQSLLDLYEANGSLYDKAKASKESLIKAHKANVQYKIEQEEARLKEIEQATLNEIKQLNAIIDKNNITGLAIPEADIKPFKDALFKPIDNKGNTKLDLMREKLTLEQRGFIDYIIFKEFKIPTLKKASEAKSFTFKKIAKDNDKRQAGRIFNSEQRSQKTEGPNINLQDIDFKQLMKITG